MTIENVIDKLGNNDKEKIAELLDNVNSIFENANLTEVEFDCYLSSHLFRGIEIVMEKLKIWC